MSTTICSIENCKKPRLARGWCPMHYQRWLKHGDPEYSAPRAPKVCVITGCETPGTRRGWCSTHYQRWRAHGNPEYVAPVKICSVESCERKVYGNGLCARHYDRLRYRTSVGYPDPEEGLDEPRTRWGTKRSEVCLVADCDERHSAMGYCESHYKRWKRHGDPTVRKWTLRTNEICVIVGCDKGRYQRGWCARHYHRWYRTGDPNKVRKIAWSESRVCSVEGCDKPFLGNTYCAAHNRTFKKHGDPTVRVVPEYRTDCSVEGCSGRHSAYGYCRSHASRFRLYGDPLAGRPTFEATDPAYLYLITHDGHGVVKVGMGKLGSRRVRSFTNRGWKVVDVWSEHPKHVVKAVETAVLDSWEDNGIRFRMPRKLMPQGGHTEVALLDAVDIGSTVTFIRTSLDQG